MANPSPHTEVMYVRVSKQLRGRLTKWRDRLNKDAPNPMNEADAVRVVLAAGMDRVEAGK